MMNWFGKNEVVLNESTFSADSAKSDVHRAEGQRLESTVKPVALTKLLSDLDKRAAREEQLGRTLKATNRTMGSYDAVTNIVTSGVYQDDLIDVPEIRQALDLKVKNAKEKEKVEKSIVRILSTVVQAYNLRHHGRDALIIVCDDKARVVGIKAPSTAAERDAYLDKTKRRLDVAAGRMERDTAAFLALPSNNPAKLLEELKRVGDAIPL